MTRERIVELLGIEHECMLRNAHGGCDRNCQGCDLAQDDGELHEMYTNAIDLLKAQKWVDVEERLPGPFEVVLISILSKNGNGEPATIESLGCREHGEWKCFVGSIREGERVTHWMPMPNGPLEG